MQFARTLLLALALLGSLPPADEARAATVPVDRNGVADADAVARSVAVRRGGTGSPDDDALAKAPPVAETPNAVMPRTTGAGRGPIARTGLDSVSRHGFSLRTALLGGSAVASAALAFAARRRTAP